MEEIKNSSEEKNAANVTENIEEQSSSAGSTPEEEMKMEELLGPETDNVIEEGKIVRVKVIGKTEEGVLVDLGLKAEGIVPRDEFKTKAQFDRTAIGDELPVYIIRLHSKDGNPVVSYKQAREHIAWDKITNAFKESTPVEGAIIKKIKGGFIVDIGVEAFLPGSQLDTYRVKDYTKYMGIKMKFIITELKKNNLVVSRRKLLELEQKEGRKKVMKDLFEGQILDGVVVRITDFGAFVDIGGMEGLLHIGDIAWYRIHKVEDIISLRQSVKVKVLKIDKEKEQVSLGLKQLSTHPWENVGGKYKVGMVVKGKITSKTDFGIFVEIEPGVEGLVHISEISWLEDNAVKIKNFKAKQEIESKIIAIDPENQKLSLSLKKLKANPWEDIKLKYPSGTKIKGVVTNITPFGAFVKINENMEGLIHVNDMSWMKKVRHPQDILKVKQEIEVAVLDVNPSNEKISLSLKHLAEDPFKKFHVGKVISGKVKRIVDFGAFVEVEHGIEALLRSSEIAQKKIGHPSEVLKVGEEIEAKVIKSDSKERKIDISIRKLERDREKELISKYVNKGERPTLGEVLEEE
ncbi:MAG: 30S ribosomal protein S1 [Endomicrobiales bacterium]|nr:30S ribosomal protein S1 [Endomicrobiales bacterium]